MQTNNRIKSMEPLPPGPGQGKAPDNSSSTARLPCADAGHATLEGQNHSAVARRLVRMGLAASGFAFPPLGVPLVQQVPWWRLWPRRARTNNLEGLGAGVFPAVASGLVTLKPDAPVGQAVFTAMLPIHDPAAALAQWTEWTVGSVLDETYPGPGVLAEVLEWLLEDRTEGERIEAWQRVLECAFDHQAGLRHGPNEHAILLLETVGRSGIRALARMVMPALRNSDQEVVLAAVACLARLGVPDGDVPAEVLLNEVRPELAEHTRWGLTFIESGDPDLLADLLRRRDWGERVQALRLAESLLTRGGPQGQSKQALGRLFVDVLLAHLQQEDDCDVVRCLAVPLGLALRHGEEAQFAKVLEVGAKFTVQGRLESLLNSLLIGGLPASFAPQVEGLRTQIAKMDSDAVRALNRLLMSLGDPSGTARDWLDSSVVVFMQMGVIQPPDAARAWFYSPAGCPEEAVTAWLLEKPTSGLRITFCAAYLAARPEFLRVLERIWIDAADDRKSGTLITVGALLAGAANDSIVSPAELRCCLGQEIGGPLEETPEMLGELLGLLMTQANQVRTAALDLLPVNSVYGRTVAVGCLRALKRKRPLFGDERKLESRLGLVPAAINRSDALPHPLQPLFSESSPVACGYERLLRVLPLSAEKNKGWVRRCLDWENPAAVKAFFEQAETAAVVCSFLQATASPDPAPRQAGARLAAGVGARLLESPLRDRVVQRVVYLAAYDGDADVRTAGRKAAEVLGIASQVPETPPPPPQPKNDRADAQQADTDRDLQDLFSELENGFGD